VICSDAVLLSALKLNYFYMLRKLVLCYDAISLSLLMTSIL
jgi:hypothetical protein